jgi:hypothetical protein
MLDQHPTSENPVGHSSLEQNVSLPNTNTDPERRERPTTDSTPSPKRNKSVENGETNTHTPPLRMDYMMDSIECDMVQTETLTSDAPMNLVAYPNRVDIPSRQTIEGLYKTAIKESNISRIQSIHDQDQSTPTAPMSQNEQLYLKPSGVLSFEKVLLPALALEEERAVKNAQSKVQRDAPEYTYILKLCRRLIRQSIEKARGAVRDASQERADVQMERRKREVLRKRAALLTEQRLKCEEQARRADERQRQKQDQLVQRKLHMARQHPRNQDFWKEVVFLTSSMAQLEKEEKMWSQMERNLLCSEEKRTTSSKEDKENRTTAACNIPTVIATKHDLAMETEQKMQDIFLASSRIQKGLGEVLKLLEDTDAIRKQFYKQYYEDHYFEGYAAVDNPKSIIRFLSQSQDDHS